MQTSYGSGGKTVVQYINWSGFQYESEYATENEARVAYDRAVQSRAYRQVHIRVLEKGGRN